MGKKRNVVLYLDGELVSKTKELGFNLSKTFENYLKLLVNQFSTVSHQNNCKSHVVGSPVYIQRAVQIISFDIMLSSVLFVNVSTMTYN